MQNCPNINHKKLIAPLPGIEPGPPVGHAEKLTTILQRPYYHN